MQKRIEKLILDGDYLFNKRQTLLTMWQEISDNFYPERADFTASRNMGERIADNLTSSYPILVRRDLGNTLSTMLRPRDKNWFYLQTNMPDIEDNDAKRWMQYASGIMRRAMYDRSSQFVRATKEGDHDFVSFGQCAISTTLNRMRNGLLYKCWHLRDMAWAENEEGKIDTIHRKWRAQRRQLVRLFPPGGNGLRQGVTEEFAKKMDSDPYGEFDIRHVVVPSAEHAPPDGVKKWTRPYVSLFIDCQDGRVLEEQEVYDCIYSIPRWVTVSGGQQIQSQYAYSPFTVAALPDARLYQAMTLTILEAGEKATNPPIIATQEVVRSDVQVFAGGITWVDADYDERMGEALRPMTLDERGLQFGAGLRADTQGSLMSASMLNKIGLPPITKEMTAFEVGQRVSEYVRNALPLFEPMESDYNGDLCEKSFGVMFRSGAFGDPRNIPQALRGKELTFGFKSPLTSALEQQKSSLFMQTKAMIADTIPMYPGASSMIKFDEALRDSLDGLGTPASWLTNKKEAAAIAVAQQKQAQAQQLLTTMGQGADVATKIGNAQQALAGTSEQQAV